jgi:hypothetical protein
MVWGKWDIKKIIENDILPEFHANRVHRIFAFNEPDHEAQANMPIEEVVDFWPLFEMANIPLTSPSVAYPLGNILWVTGLKVFSREQTRKVFKWRTWLFIGMAIPGFRSSKIQ